MWSGWPRNLGGLVVSMTGEPEGRRGSKVQACAEGHPKKHRSEQTGAGMVSPSEGNEARREGQREVLAPP